MIKIIKGNIFTTKCQTIVNTVNCVGVMGAGIAFECRLRYKDMYEKYVQLCEENKIKIGTLWLYKSEERWILNFPTKQHWKFESKPEYLEKGLLKFIETYQEKGITSIAFPLLGANKGGISEDVSLEIMKNYLTKCNIEIEIYYYDPFAYDDLFLDFKNKWNSYSEADLANYSGMSLRFVKKIKEALKRDDIRSLSRLLSVEGIGEKTLEKSFHFIKSFKNSPNQLNLFNM